MGDRSRQGRCGRERLEAQRAAGSRIACGGQPELAAGQPRRGASAVAWGVAGAQHARSAPVARPPAAGVPVPTVGKVAPPVGRPGNHVRDTRPDLLLAAGAAVRLARRAARDRPDQPVAVAPLLDRLDTAAHPLVVQRLARTGGTAPPAPPGRLRAGRAVTTRTHAIKVTSSGFSTQPRQRADRRAGYGGGRYGGGRYGGGRYGGGRYGSSRSGQVRGSAGSPAGVSPRSIWSSSVEPCWPMA